MSRIITILIILVGTAGISLQAQVGVGAFQWVDYGTSITQASLIDVKTDSNKNIYLLGHAYTSPTYKGTPMPTTMSGGFLMKLDSARNITWLKSVPSLAHGRIELDENNNIYVADVFHFPMFSNTVQVDTITMEINPGFPHYRDHINYLAKFNNSGNILWLKTAGKFNEQGSSGLIYNRRTVRRRPDLKYRNGHIHYIASYIQLDTTGNQPYPPHLTHFEGQRLTPSTLLTYNQNNPAGAVLAKLDTAGNLMWKKDFYRVNHTTGSSYLNLGGVEVDNQGNVYANVSGVASHMFEAMPLTVHYGGASSTFVQRQFNIVKVDSAGNFIMERGYRINSPGFNNLLINAGATTITRIDTNIFVYTGVTDLVTFTPNLTIQGSNILKLDTQLHPVDAYSLNPSVISGLGTLSFSKTRDNHLLLTGISTGTFTAPNTLPLSTNSDIFALKLSTDFNTTSIAKTTANNLGSGTIGYGVSDYYDGSILVCGNTPWDVYFDSIFSSNPLTRFFLAKIIPCDSLNTLAQSTATVICPGDSALLFDAGDTTLTKYRWFHNNAELPSNSEHELKVGSGGDYFFVADSLGCRDTSDVISIQVTPNPQVTVQPSAITVCDDASPFTLTGGQPTGGHWTGNGVLLDSIFDASLTGQGNFTVFYHYTDSAGCSDSAAKNIVVSTAQSPTILPVSNACEGDSNLSLTSSVFPTGGTFSGTAVTQNGIFNPAVAGVGSHTFTYTYTNSSGCSAASTGSVTVNPAPQVSLTSLPDACSQVVSVPLTGGSPAGGSWSGNGVAGSNFFPPAAGIGSHPITYTASQNGCSASATTSIEVIPKSTGEIDSVPYLCRNDSGIILSASPSGGFFYGPDVRQDSVFVPQFSAAGASDVYYVYQNACGTDTVMDSIQVISESIVPQIDSLPPLFCFGDSSTLLEASPSGGIFWGNGVVQTHFHPDTAGVGASRIYYRITDSNGCVGYDSVNVTVQPEPLTSFTPVDTVCYHAPAVDLSQFSSPPGGVFSGTPVSGSDFIPSAPPGLYAVEHSYTDSFGCTSRDTAQIRIFETPSPQWSAPAALCENTSGHTLSNYTPQGGVFTGNGISNVQFFPQVAGVGEHAVTYTFTTTCGANSITDTITVNSAPVVSLDTFNDICQNHGLLNLTGGTPQGGVFSGAQVSAGSFDPGQGLGSYDVIYSYTDSNSCTAADTQSITVYDTPNPVWNPAADSFCNNQAAISLTQGAPTGGSFSGAGVTNNMFNPSALSAGTYPVVYTVSTSCGARHDTADFYVNPTPQASITADSVVCSQSPAVTLNGQPQGGSFWGTGVTGNTFDPAVSGIGNFSIEYAFTDSNQCSDTAFESIAVVPEPVAQFSMPDTVCDYADSLYLEAGASPAGGFFAGAGVFNAVFYPDSVAPGAYQIQYFVQNQFGCADTTFDSIRVVASTELSFAPDTAVCQSDSMILLERVRPAGGVYSGNYVANDRFDPVAAGLGSHTVNYTYQDTNRCTSQTSFVLEVNPLPEVEIGTVPTLCLNDSAVVLSAIGSSPPGGFYSFNDSLLSLINPADYSPGSHNISYTFTDSLGCTAEDTTSFNVFDLPEVAFNFTDSICNNFSAIALNQGSPQGGVFTGAGIANDELLPEMLPPGYHSVFYSFTDSNGCTNTDSSHFILLEAADITFTDTALCLNESLMVYGSDQGENYWSTGDTTPEVRLTRHDTGIVSLTAITHGLCTSTGEMRLTGLIPPEPQLPAKPEYCLDDEIVLTTVSTHPVYEWSTGETTPDVRQSASFLGTGPHNYTVTVTSANGCSGVTTTSVNIIDCDTMGDFRFRVYPVPTTLNYLNIELFWPGNDLVKGTLISASGQLVRVFDLQLPDHPNVFTIFTYGIAAGKYTLVLEGKNDEIHTREILIAN